MNFFAISALVNVATSVVLGLLVLSADRKAFLNRIFAAFATSLAFWSYAYFMWQIAADSQSALLWSHLLMAGAIFITPVYFHFIVRFLGQDRRLSVAAGYIFAITFSIINWSPLFISGIEEKISFGFWPNAGPLFLPFLIWWIWYAVYPVYLLLRTKPGSGIDAHGIRTLLAGTIIGYAGGCTNYFLWYDIGIQPFGNISASIYIASVAYVIMRNRLFNMKVIATELLIFALWLFLFIRLLLSEGTQGQLADGALLFVSLVIGVLLIRSVDKEVEQRELIEKQEHELQDINRQQESLLHFVSHEVKGYLTKSEAAFAAIYTGDYGKVEPKLHDMSGMALADVRKGVDTVIDILDASNLKRGTVAFAKDTFNIVDAVAEIVTDLRPVAEERGLELIFERPVTGAYTIVGDKDKIRRHVIRNLIDNSIRYTLKGSVRIELSRNDSVVRMVVTDTGVGITADDMKNLFTEGGKGAESLKVNVHSTGYGLFIAKTIVVGHGGRIWAESDGKDKGSRFIMELPTQSAK